MFFEALNKNLKMLLQPESEEPAELKDIKGEFDSKTPGQRLRGVLWIWWKQQGEVGEFDDFYRKKIEAMIAGVKNNLKPV